MFAGKYSPQQAVNVRGDQIVVHTLCPQSSPAKADSEMKNSSPPLDALQSN